MATPASGATIGLEVVLMESSPLIEHHSVSISEPEDGLLPNVVPVETLDIVEELEGGQLRVPKVFIPPVTSCPRRNVIDFDFLLMDRSDQLILGDLTRITLPGSQQTKTTERRPEDLPSMMLSLHHSWPLSTRTPLRGSTQMAVPPRQTLL